MSLLPRFMRKEAEEAPLVPELPEECGHWELAPRWDRAEDIGKKDKVTYLACTTCQEVFSPSEAERLVA